MKRFLIGIIFLLPFSLLAQYPQHALHPEQLYYDMSYYDIDLSVDVAAHFISGHTEIEGTITHDGTYQIILNFYVNMSVDSVKAQGQDALFNHSNNLLTVSLPTTLNNGDPFSVVIYYHGYPTAVGPFSSGLNFTTYNGQNLVYSYHWPYFAETYIPCKDHPSDKADSVRIAITVPDIYEVGSNGVLTATNILPGNQKQFVWESHYPMTPYHISINIYPFDVIQSNYPSPVSGNIFLEYFLFPNHTPTAEPQLNTVVPKIIEAFESRFGAFPFHAEKYGICESVISGGMEHQTILTMNYASFFSDVVVHESGHEYFGNLISIADWGHIWLSEGFATYGEAIYREYWEGTSGYQNEILQHMSGSGNGAIHVSDASNPVNIIPYDLVYLKASTVLHMLRFVMGDTLFFQMLNDYVTTSQFRNKNIDTEQFENFCESYYGNDLSWFFDQWIYGDGRVAANYYHYWNPSTFSLEFKIQSVPSGGTTYHHMPIPLQLGTSGPGNQIADTVWIDSLTTNKQYVFGDTTNLQIQIDPDNWILKVPFNRMNHPTIDSLYLWQDTLRVRWEPFFDFTNYKINIYKDDNGNWVLISSQTVTEFSFSFHPTEAGLYGFEISAIENNHQTDPSPISSIYYSDFPMDQGILLVDETRNGDGGNMWTPTDGAVDSFYNSLLDGFSYQQLDIINENRPLNVSDVEHYSTIIWHHDVLYTSYLSQSEITLRTYLNAGGRILFSGAKVPTLVSENFREQYLGVQNTQTNNQADFVSASGEGEFNDLPVDSSKITTPAYNYRLPFVTIFDSTNLSESIHRYQSGSGNPTFQNEICGVSARSVLDTTQFAAITLGFPLYFIEPDSARSFMVKALEVLGEAPTKIAMYSKQNPQDFHLFQNYPNPFNPNTTIEFVLPKSVFMTLKIYNILGQEVATLVSERLAAGNYKYEWDASGLASGVYMYRLEAGKFKQVRKMLLVR